MSDTVKTPRAHAELAARYMSDSSLKCWLWDPSAEQWDLRRYPVWHEDVIYHVGHEKPTAPPKRKVTIAGITFDAPETEAPKVGTKYWLVDMDRAISIRWRGIQIERQWLTSGMIHLDKESACLHSQALNELNRQLCGMEELLRKEASND